VVTSRIQQKPHQASPQSLTLKKGGNRDVKDMRLTTPCREDTVSDKLLPLLHHPTGITHPQAIMENPGAPAMRVNLLLDRHHRVNITVQHRA